MYDEQCTMYVVLYTMSGVRRTVRCVVFDVPRTGRRFPVLEYESGSMAGCVILAVCSQLITICGLNIGGRPSPICVVLFAVHGLVFSV